MTRKKDKKLIADLNSEWRRLDEMSGGNHSLELIMDAARRNNPELLQVLDQEIGINCTENGKTALFWLAGEADLNALQLLITKGAKVNAAEKGAASPLMHAAFRNRFAVINFLVQHGAKVDYCDANGDSALSFAQEQGHDDVVNYLISVMANKK